MREESGQGAVEILLVLLVLLPILFGAFSLAQGVILKHNLDVSAEKAARVLSVNPSDYSYAEYLIRSEVESGLLGAGYGQRVVIRLYDAVTRAEISPADLAGAGFGYRFVVQAEVPWRADIPFLSSGPQTISVLHFGMVERFRDVCVQTFSR